MRFCAVLALLVTACTDGTETDTVECTDHEVEQVLVFVDQDGDGFGSEPLYVPVDADDPQFVESGGDCNDLDETIKPGADELCDGIDNDCNGTPDDNAGDDWYIDGDGDGFGAGEPVRSCEAVAGAVVDGGDCDDTNIDVAPGLEVCDGLDTDCDDTTAPDEGALCPAGATWHDSGDSVYLIFDDAYTRAEADAACLAVGYHLVFVESADEESDLLGWMGGFGEEGVWTGGISGLDCPADMWSWYDNRDASCAAFTGYANDQGLPGLNGFALALETDGNWRVTDPLGVTTFGTACEAEY